jgi:uncharacterized membrane-anchored protein
MRIGPVRLSAASIAVLVIQLALVCSVAGKYLYQRWTCQRVWTRTAAFDPELIMRGRYLSLQLTVDGCSSTLPSAKQAEFPRDVNGAAVSGEFGIRNYENMNFPAELRVIDNRLAAIHIRDPKDRKSSQMVTAWRATSCKDLRLVAPVNFYIAEHSRSPLPMATGAELWIEVTVPPKGPPRPIQLALKQNGAWEPFAFE